MSTLDNEIKILKEYLEKQIKRLEQGKPSFIRGGYIYHTNEECTIDRHCDKIVNKLIELGYEYTTNHGFGCRDYRFMKKITL